MRSASQREVIYINNYKHFLVLVAFVAATLLVYQPSPIFVSNYEEGEISTKDVIAHKSITYEDEEATKELLRSELDKVDNIYKKDLEIFEDLMDDISEFEVSVATYQENKKDIKDERERVREARKNADKKELDKDDVEEKEIEKMKVSDIKNPLGLEESSIKRVTELSEGTIRNFFNYIGNELDKIYDAGIPEDQLKRTIEIIRSDSNLFMFPEVMRKDVLDAITMNMRSNQSLDVVGTEEAKIKVEEDLEPVYKKIKKGEAVVRKHEEISEEHLLKLRELGLMDREIDVGELFKSLPVVLLVSLLFHFYCSKYLLEDMKSIRTYSVTLGLLFIVILLSDITIGSDWNLIPILSVLIILTMFWPRSFVLVVTVLLSLLISSGEVITLMLILVAGLFSTILHKQFTGFTDSLRNGLILGVVVASSNLFLSLMFEQFVAFDSFTPLALSGIFAGVIATGTIPFLEKILGKVTVYRLTELNTLEHPLLVRLYEEARGTFDHSRNVADLVTVASQRIGTNTLLLRVAALYHDVGKLKHPEHFIENSNPDDNINNQINPLEAAKVILAHPHISVKLGKENNFPKEVLQLIERHHGDSTLEHFYQRALKEGVENILPEDFQYKTHPPVSKEETILMLADVCEAYSRLFPGANYREMRKNIGEVVDKKISNGDLRKSELTIQEITLCLDEFAKTLTASEHKRVEY